MDWTLGRAARAQWLLREDGTFLNHGSYGACPRPVLEAHAALRLEAERHPDAFMARIHPDGQVQAVRDAAAALQPLLNAPAEGIALVENATSAVNAVLAAFELAPGDEVLATDHQYNAVRLTIEARCRATGAVPRVVALPVPTHPDDILQRVLDGVGPRTRLAVLDHLTSPSAIVLPLERLVPELVRRGVAVLVDGAHALGQLPLDLEALGADWYVTNAHKWLYAPRGCALLHAAGRAAPRTAPLVTSHYVGLGFPRSFDYVGTRDYTAWLALPAAVAFHRSIGAERLASHCVRLVELGSEALEACGARPVAPRDARAFMRAFELPQSRAAQPADAGWVMRSLWERERIQIRCALVAGKLLLRFCAQAYVDEDDVRRLGEALERHGWPERSLL